MSEQLYARIHNGEVFEYRLTALQIANAGDNVGHFLPVKFGYKPKKAPKYHNIAEEAQVFSDHVVVNYIIRPMGLQALLMYVHYVNGDNNQPRSNITVAQVEPALIRAVQEAATLEVQKLLDKFARQKNYDSIVTASTYRNSPVPQFAAEGMRANEVRDRSWAALYMYLDGVLTGNNPLPASVEDILKNVPPMSWA